MIRKWAISDDQLRKQCVDEIIARIGEEDDTGVGMICAQDIIDIVAKYIAPNAYNMAVEDSKKIVDNKLADLEVDFDLLKVAV